MGINTDSGFYKTIKLALVFIIAMILFKLIVSFVTIQNDIIVLGNQIDNLEQENQHLNKEHIELIDRLDHIDNIEIIEKKARNLLNMTKPGEKIYRIIKD